MRIGTAILTLVLALGLASPVSAASALSRDDGSQEKAVPVVVDVLVLRPMGLAMTALGAVVYAFPVAPLTAMTRPSDLGKPFKMLVATPARYTFADPLGQH
ncbi:MAG: hypothetical protein ACQGVC_03280 [Myxococcota bacterium]